MNVWAVSSNAVSQAESLAQLRAHGQKVQFAAHINELPDAPAAPLLILLIEEGARLLESCLNVRARFGATEAYILAACPAETPLEMVTALLAAGADDVLDWPADIGALARRASIAGTQLERRNAALSGSERKRLEADVKASHDFLNTVINTVPEPIFVKDEQHRWILLNNAFCAFMGHPTEALLGKSDFDFFPAEEAEVFWQQDQLVFDTSQPSENEESLTDAKGQTHVISTKKAAFTGPDGKRMLVGVIHDLTERRRLEAQLLKADRLASVGTLAAGVAHEINNPLTFILTDLQFLEGQVRNPVENGPLSPEDLRLCIDEMLEGAERVRTVVQGLRAFARPDDGRRASLELRSVLESALRLIQNELHYRAQLVLQLTDLPLIEGNESQLAQVFVNLLTNAVQSLPPGGPERNRITVASRESEGEVAIEVRDNGVGIPPELRSRIFDPFFTTKQIGLGTGLGLSICHGIVTSHGGRIDVESAADGGSIFRVVLPTLSTRTAQEPAALLPSPAAVPALPRILVVDDEPLVGMVLERALRGEAQITHDTDAHASLKRIEAGEPFDIVLCDLMMPSLPGDAFYRELLRLRPELAERTGFITGGAFTDEAQAFVDSSGRPVIYKPFDLGALQAFVSGLMPRMAAPPALPPAA